MNDDLNRLKNLVGEKTTENGSPSASPQEAFERRQAEYEAEMQLLARGGSDPRGHEGWKFLKRFRRR